MLAPAGNATFMNGCWRLRTNSFTSVSDRPWLVTSVVTVADCATAASRLVSGKRVHSSARRGDSPGVT